jgi:hypothetical protein
MSDAKVNVTAKLAGLELMHPGLTGTDTFKKIVRCVNLARHLNLIRVRAEDTGPMLFHGDGSADYLLPCEDCLDRGEAVDLALACRFARSKTCAKLARYRRQLVHDVQSRLYWDDTLAKLVASYILELPSKRRIILD